MAKAPKTAATVEEKRKATRKRLLEDFEFYARKALKIRTKDAKIVPFVLNRAQRRFLDAVLRQWQETGRIRVVILKARQLGLSTVWGGFMYWWISQHKATKGIVVTHKAEASTALFDMTKRFHAEMLPFLRPSTSKANGRELKFDKLDSGYMIATAGADTVGRGETLQVAHLSEVGLWPKGKAREIMNGLMQAVPDEPDTFVAIESTARGMSGPFYEAWRGAVDGSTGFLPCFLPWFVDERYSVEPPDDFERTPDEEEYCLAVYEEYDEHLTDGQLLFRRRKIAQDGPDLFKQEYPTFPNDAFLTSGAPVFNLEYLNECAENAPEIKHRLEYDPVSKAFVADPRGRLFIYREHDPHEDYTIGADVSKGIGKGDRVDETGRVVEKAEGDHSVAIVLDRKKRLVAVWRGQVDPDFYAEILYALGQMFNWAYMAVEFNNHGILPNTRLHKDMAYPNLYVREVYDKERDETREELGFYTDVKTRPLIIDQLREAVRNKEIELNDRTTIEEMTTFVADPKTGKIEHEVGCHDDCVFALAIANHIHEGSWTPVEAEEDFYFEMIA